MSPLLRSAEPPRTTTRACTRSSPAPTSCRGPCGCPSRARTTRRPASRRATACTRSSRSTTRTEEIVGFGELITTPDEPRARHAGEIDLVAVSEDSQSQGVGSALMDSMIDLADNWLDLKRLSLIAFVGNDRAIALYERLGFEREGIMRRVGYGDGDWMDAVMMARLRD
ncbi:MAG: GNAT family N-acetyltransferase [Microcella pacifica]